MEDRQLSLKWNNQKKTFFENLKVLREKSNYTDATLAVDGKFYPVHKLVMITCSEYFSDIFEQTSCKSPVIVLKDVPSCDIEALLDYMYLGEVNVNQNDLASLLKTAECLKIKGLAVPDEDPTKLSKKTTDSHVDDRRNSPPPKRQRFDSNTKPQQPGSPILKKQCFDSNTIPQQPGSPILSPKIPTSPLVGHFQSYSIPPHSASTNEQDEPTVVKIETDDEEQDERFRDGKKNERGASTSRDRNPGEDYWSDISKTEHEFEYDDAGKQDERVSRENKSEGGVSDERSCGGGYGYDIAKTIHNQEIYVNNSSFPESSVQEINQLFANTSNTKQDKPPVDQEPIFIRETNNIGTNNSGNHGPFHSNLPKVAHKPENYGNTSNAGSLLQQGSICGWLPSETLANFITCRETYATHTNDDMQRWGRMMFKDGSLLLQDFRSDKPPTGALIFNLCEMTEHMSSPRHVYLSLSAKDKYLGRVVIRVNEQAPQRAQQLTDLCIGQTGDRYSGCRALRVLNKSDPCERLYFSSYLTANNTISVKKLYPSLEKTEGIAHMKGLVVMACDDRADFSILTKTGHTDLWPGPAIGKVVSGMPFVEYIVNYNLVKWHLSKSQVTITESGLVIDSGCQNWLLSQISKKGENGYKSKHSAD